MVNQELLTTSMKLITSIVVIGTVSLYSAVGGSADTFALRLYDVVTLKSTKVATFLMFVAVVDVVVKILCPGGCSSAYNISW